MRLTGICALVPSSIGEDDDNADVPDEPTYSPLPPAFSITAEQLDSTTHTVKMRRKREKKHRNNKPVKEAQQAVATTGSLKTASSMSELDKAQETRRKHRKTIREFEASHPRQHDKHHQELRTKRAYQTFASAERKFVQNYGRTHRKLMMTLPHQRRNMSFSSHQLTIVVQPVHSTLDPVDPATTPALALTSNADTDDTSSRPDHAYSLYWRRWDRGGISPQGLHTKGRKEVPTGTQSTHCGGSHAGKSNLTELRLLFLYFAKSTVPTHQERQYSGHQCEWSACLLE